VEVVEGSCRVLEAALPLFDEKSVVLVAPPGVGSTLGYRFGVGGMGYGVWGFGFRVSGFGERRKDCGCSVVVAAPDAHANVGHVHDEAETN